MLKKYLKYLGLAFGLLAIIALVMNRGWFMGFQRGLQNSFYDDDQASSEIIVVAIDENSLGEKALGSLTSWPRAYYAQAIDRLNQNGAAAIGIDLTFPNTSIHGQEDDQTLANALKKYDNVILATRYFFENGRRQVEWANDSLDQALPHYGWINVLLDEDGFVRQLPIFTESSKGVIDAFSLAIARIYLNAPPSSYRMSDHQFYYSDKITIPIVTQKDGTTGESVNLMNINYFAKPNAYKNGGYRQISFVDLLNGKLIDKAGKKIDFRDKIVLIGPTAVDLQDDYLSPVSKGVRMPGVEIHANAIQTVITGEFLKNQSPQSLWLLIGALLTINIIVFAWLRVRYGVLLVLAEMVGMVIAGIFAYEYQFILNVAYPILTIILSFTGTYLLRLMIEQKERKFIEGAFSRYVNKDVVQQIQKDPKMLMLGGAKHDLTIMFSDIAGFTTISEGFEPEELVGFLNEYLGEMTDIIMNYQGTLDKYEGDAIMAFWNAPIPQHNHALNACLAALENQKRLAELRQKWARAGMPEMKVRIGIHTGEAVVGNMGSKNRFNYTAVGDNVNLASRLEGINKQYGTYLMISQHTYEEVKDKLICRELDDIRVKGKSKPVKIYELMTKKEGLTPELQKTLDTFAEGLKLYRNRQFSEAKAKFETLKNDAPSLVFVKRCEVFIQSPPEDHWDGVWNFEVK